MSVNKSKKISNSRLFYFTVGSVLSLLFIHLFKQSKIVDMKYKIQNTKNKKTLLEKELQDLKKNLTKLKSNENIYKKANKIGLKKINIRQIEKYEN
jgi:cell division protein FtsL